MLPPIPEPVRIHNEPACSRRLPVYIVSCTPNQDGGSEGSSSESSAEDNPDDDEDEDNDYDDVDVEEMRAPPAVTQPCRNTRRKTMSIRQ